MVAYDCSVPAHLEPVQEDGSEYCNQLVPPPAESAVPRHAVLLQRAPRLNITAVRCEYYLSVSTTYCGVYDHQTVANWLSHPLLPQTVPADHCAHWHDNKMWSSEEFDNHPKEKEHPIEIGDWIAWSEDTVGESYAAYDGSEVKCKGGTLYTPFSEPLKDVVQIRHHNLRVTTVTLDYHPGDNTISFPQEGRTLATPPSAGESVRNGETLVWHPPLRQDSCTLYNVRRDTGAVLTGRVYTTPDGDEWFEGPEGSHIRVKLMEPRFECGSAVRATNYGALFYSEDLSNKDFSRKIPSTDVSLSTYINLQDAYIFDTLLSQMRTSFLTAIRHDCLQRAHDREARLASLTAERATSLDGTTVHMDDDGWFLTKTGDAWYRYRCRRITVQALEHPTCYNGLPVRLTPDDYAIWSRTNYRGPPEAIPGFTYANGTPAAAGAPGAASPPTLVQGEELKFFVTPGSHRLTSIGSPRPCVMTMPSLFRNANGRWLTVSPELRLLQDVTVAGGNWTLPNITATPDFNAEGGGLYSAEDLRRQEELSQSPRLAQDMAVKFARTALRYGMGGSTGAGGQINLDDTAASFFDSLPTLGLGLLETIWSWLNSAATILAIVTGLYLLVKLGIRLAATGLRCCAIKEQYGLASPFLCTACWPQYDPNQGPRRSLLQWYRGHRYFSPDPEQDVHLNREDMLQARRVRRQQAQEQRLERLKTPPFIRRVLDTGRAGATRSHSLPIGVTAPTPMELNDYTGRYAYNPQPEPDKGNPIWSGSLGTQRGELAWSAFPTESGNTSNGSGLAVTLPAEEEHYKTPRSHRPSHQRYPSLCPSPTLIPLLHRSAGADDQLSGASRATDARLSDTDEVDPPSALGREPSTPRVRFSLQHEDGGPAPLPSHAEGSRPSVEGEK